MKTTIISAVIMSLTVAPFAQTRAHSEYDGKHHSRKDTWARVVDVREVFEEYVERVPIEECSSEDSVHHSSNGSATPAILGGIIGGAVGNSLGHHKSSKKVGAVVGAVLGASIGHDIGDTHRVSRHYGHSRRCETYYEEHVYKRVVGYDVDYRYCGRIYTTYRESYPGKRIRVDHDNEEHDHRGNRYRQYDHWY